MTMDFDEWGMSLFTSGVKSSLLNLKVFCIKENIKGCSDLKKIEILKLLSDRHDSKSRSIVSHSINKASLKDLVNFYIFLSESSDLKLQITNRLYSCNHKEWKTISSYKVLTKEFICDFSKQLNWEDLSKNPCLTEDLIKQFSSDINFKELSKRPKLPQNIMRKYKDELDWYVMSYTQRFSESFLREMITELKITQTIWCNLARYQRLSDKFLKDHIDFIYDHASSNSFWVILAENQYLSESFILAHLSELPWWTLCTCQRLSTEVLLKLCEIVETCYGDDKTFWDLVSVHQHLSAQFLHQHSKNIQWKLLVKFQLLKEDIILKFKTELGRSNILQYQKHLSREFIETHLLPYNKTEEKIMCSVCLEDTVDGVKTSPCQHNFCEPCLLRCLDIKPLCPYCRGNL